MPIAVNTNSSINSVIQDISRFGILQNFVRVQEIETHVFIADDDDDRDDDDDNNDDKDDEEER